MRTILVLLALAAFGVTISGCHADAGVDKHGAAVDVGTK